MKPNVIDATRKQRPTVGVCLETLLSDTFQNRFNWLAEEPNFSPPSFFVSNSYKGAFSNGVTLKICNIACSESGKFICLRMIAMST